jgi:tetratricopeptide (TPR) repeat protein
MPAALAPFSAPAQTTAGAQPTPDWRRIAQALLLVIATILCYAPSLRGGFLWDDRELLVDNPLMKSAAGLWRIWFSTAPYDYYPVDYTSLWLGWHLWGADPLGYRVVNLALHLGSAFIFWRLLTVWRLRGAWFAALLFALHPLNVASVAWIAERKNVLSMIFYLATLLCWACAEEETAFPARRRALYGGALAAFALALGSKSSVVMFPAVLLVLVWWRRGLVRWPDLRRTLPFFGLSLAAGLVSLWFQHRIMLPPELATPLPLAARAVLLGKTIWFYLGKTWFPHPLVMIYPQWQLWPLRPLDFLPLGALILLCGAALYMAIRLPKSRGLAAALAFFCLNLLPVAGLFQMPFQSLSYVSDHFAYISSLSMCALFAAVLGSLGPKPGSRWISALAMTFIVAICGALTCQRAADFGSSERLWQKTIALNPDSAAAQNNYGLALQENGRMQAAEAHFRVAMRLHPTMPAELTNFADLLRQEHRWSEAADAYRRLLTIQGRPVDYNNYGVVLLYLGDSTAATAQFRQALSLNPALFSAHYNLYKLARAANDQAAMAAELRACQPLDSGRQELASAVGSTVQ